MVYGINNWWPVYAIIVIGEFLSLQQFFCFFITFVGKYINMNKIKSNGSLLKNSKNVNKSVVP